MTDLAKVLAATTTKMRGQLEEARAALGHAPTKGGAYEEILRQFLGERLPASLGVTTGQVLAADGSISKQIDVIIYDARRTPLLFEAALGGSHCVPAEGVVAVVEVKAHVGPSDLDGVLKNCLSVKQLPRQAYMGDLGGHFEVYGQRWAELPIYYSLFAFESGGIYADILNKLQLTLPLHQRIDTACFLEKGAALNVDRPDKDSSTMGLSAHATMFGLVEVPSESALLHWYLTLTTAVLQAETRPIDLLPYAQEHLDIHLPDSVGAQRARAALQVEKLLSNANPADQELIMRVFGGAGGFTADEQARLEALGFQFTPPPGTGDS